MTDIETHKHHPRKTRGLTQTIKHMILKDQRAQDRNTIIDELIIKYNSPSRVGYRHLARKTSKSKSPIQDRRRCCKQLLRVSPQHQVRLSVENGHRIQISKNSLTKTYSLQKLTLHLNTIKSRRSAHNLRLPLFSRIMAQNSEESNLSRQQLLVQNQKMRQLCFDKEARLTKLIKQIDQLSKNRQCKKCDSPRGRNDLPLMSSCEQVQISQEQTTVQQQKT